MTGRSMRVNAVVLLTACLVCPAQSKPAGSEWIRLSSGSLEVFTDAGEKTARQALDRLNQIRQVIPAAEPQGPRPLRVSLFASRREYQQYAPGASVPGFYQSGVERDSIVAQADGGLDRVVVHEYIHFVLDQGGSSLPAWFQEGTAEFYSNVEVSRGRARVGKPLEEHRDLLKRSTWLDAGQLRSPPPGEEAGQRLGALYYAQSWALVHMLNLDPAYRAGMARYVQLLTGESAAEDDERVFEQAFGKSLDQALTSLRAYIPRMRDVTVDAPVVEEAAVTPPERLTAPEALLLRAELALTSRRPMLATELYQQAAREYPDTSAAEFGLGALASARGQADAARDHLERACRLDPGNAAAWFEYAMLEQETGGGAGRVRELLEKTVEANPNHGEAQLLLGVRATDEGRYDAALTHLEQASRLLPRKSHVWHALAYAQLKMGKPAAAAVSARRAARTAATPEQSAMAEALLRSAVEAVP